MKLFPKLTALGLSLTVLAGCSANTGGSTGSGTATTDLPEGQQLLTLSDDAVTLDGEPVGTDTAAAVYLSHDIIYYEDRDTYDSGNPYGEGMADERHTAAEAAAHTVVNITQPGAYRLTGSLSQGQIAVDLGEDAVTDPEAVVTLVLDNADITCTVAPAVIFYNVYECDESWVAYDSGEAEAYEASPQQDTSAAGANVILADGSINTVTGSHVARIYKDNADQKKKYKYDGAFYSVMSLNVDGETAGNGVLNIIADNEGLDSEQHLTLNGGKVNIASQDDGINTNEDGVSVTTINGGALHIVAGLGAEGDGVDSNGYLVINGGVVIATANPASDSGLDSDCGSYINGGTVVATGSTMDWAESDSAQVTLNLQFASQQAADEAIVITDATGAVVFAYDPDQDETTGADNRGYQGAIVSSPNLRVGETYSVYVGGDVTGTDVDGLYDPATVTGFTGGVQQMFTGSDVGGFGGPLGQPPEGFDGERPELPEGADGERPEPPEGMDGERPELPEGADGERPTPPDKPENGNGQPPEMPAGQTGEAASGSCDFVMTDTVNAFSGVQDVVAAGE